MIQKIKIGVIGVGNCASALLQGIEYYRTKKPEDAIGLMHWKIGNYLPSDIEIALAFDIDERKVGLDVNEAIFQKPNCAKVFMESMPRSNVIVKMGRVLDGFPVHMKESDKNTSFLLSTKLEPSRDEIITLLRDSGTEILLNYLPVGSEEATRFYAECALEANVAFINNIPVFIASDPIWVEKFKKKNIPIIGDDIKAQLGATITHRSLIELFKKRGVKIERSYQLNTGGNTDFLCMLDRSRLQSKKISKTEAVQSIGELNNPEKNLHVGPSDYVPWQRDNKVCFLRIEGKIFGDIAIDLELRLSVEDSPNSAGVAIDAIRCCKLALDNKIGGVLVEPSAYFCKHPLTQFADSVAYEMVNKFIEDNAI